MGHKGIEKRTREIIILSCEILGFGLFWFSFFYVVSGYNAGAGSPVPIMHTSRIVTLIAIALVFVKTRRENLPLPLLWAATIAQLLSWVFRFMLSGTGAAFAWLGALLAGFATATFVLFFAQSFSRHSHKNSAIAIIAGFCLSHLASILSLYSTGISRSVIQATALALALALLIVSQLANGNVRESLQSQTTSSPPFSHSLKTLLRPTALMGLIAAGASIVLVSALFGAFLQISTVEGINLGLFDLLSESVSITFLLLLLVLTILNRMVRFEKLFLVVALIIATALLLSPLFWNYQPFSSSIAIKCGFVVFLATLWVTIARWSYQHPKLKTTTFGMVLALSWASTLLGQMFGQVVRDIFGIDLGVITAISLVTTWIMVMLSVLLFAYLLRNKRDDVPPLPADENPPTPSIEIPDGSLSDNYRESIEHLGQHIKLSPRELEVLTLFVYGRSAKYISRILVISEFTVKTHLRNIYKKVGIHTRQELLDILEQNKQKNGTSAGYGANGKNETSKR